MDGLIRKHEFFNATDLHCLTRIAERDRRHAMMSRDVGVVNAVIKFDFIVIPGAALDGVVAGSANLEKVGAIAAGESIASGTRNQGIVTAAALKQLMSS